MQSNVIQKTTNLKPFRDVLVIPVNFLDDVAVVVEQLTDIVVV